MGSHYKRLKEMAKSVKSYQDYQFSSGSVAGEDYRSFERTCKNELKRKAEADGFKLYSFHPMHYEWSAVLEKNGKYVYVSINDVRWFNWYNSVLVRSMKIPEDWTGGVNNTCSWDKVIECANNVVESGY